MTELEWLKWGRMDEYDLVLLCVFLCMGDGYLPEGTIKIQYRLSVAWVYVSVFIVGITKKGSSELMDVYVDVRQFFLSILSTKRATLIGFARGNGKFFVLITVKSLTRHAR